MIDDSTQSSRTNARVAPTSRFWILWDEWTRTAGLVGPMKASRYEKAPQNG